MNKIFLVFGGAVAAAACFYYPLNGAVLFAALAAYGVALWFFPFMWMFAVPAFLPVLDFSPVTGLLFFNEFDLVILTTVLIFHLRTNQNETFLPFPKGSKPLIVLLSVAYAVSTVKGMFPLEAPGVNSFTNYYSGYISLRGVKGYIGALLLLPLIRNGIGSASNIKKYLIPGFLTGFAAVILVALWERHVFPGLLDFSSDYRITSTFFEMATGGAYIDAYLSMVLPFVFTCFLFWKTSAAKLIGLGLFGAGLYTMLVTFSRICYASFLISMIPLVTGVMACYKKQWKTVLSGGIMILVAALITIPVLKGGYIKDRFANFSQSVETRTLHWKEAVQKMDRNWATLLFGMGPGSYPKTYFQKFKGDKPGSYQFKIQDNNQFLRLFPGEFLYFGQRISLDPGAEYMLTVDVRSSEKKGRLSFPICEKSISYSFECNWKTINMVNEAGRWGSYSISYPEFNIGQGSLYQKRPVEFALYNNNKNTVIDVDNIRLTDGEGNNIIKNGDFSSGMDFWFFAIENHLAWHIFNVWVNLFFELGIMGLAVFIVFVWFILHRLIQGMLKKDMLSFILVSSFCGFFVVGLVGSLLDAPRILFLFYFISFLSLFYPSGNAWKN